jgi:hypothetical protein
MSKRKIRRVKVKEEGELAVLGWRERLIMVPGF